MNFMILVQISLLHMQLIQQTMQGMKIININCVSNGKLKLGPWNHNEKRQLCTKQTKVSLEIKVKVSERES